MHSIINPEHYRYERKFAVSELSIHEIESLINLHPALFSEIYHERNVNNIYFDTVGFDNYLDNVIGISRRIKVRVRWYQDLFGEVQMPCLELKIKNGQVGGKLSYVLDPIIIDDTFSFPAFIDLIKKSSVIPEHIKTNFTHLRPTLLNTYIRKYYQTADKNFRITIDKGLAFTKIEARENSFLQRSLDDINTIVELKYNKNLDDQAEKITRHLPFPITKSSKYVSGINMISGMLHE